jgi:hypothetical protein
MVYTQGKDGNVPGLPSDGETSARKRTAKRRTKASGNLPQVQIYVGFAIAQRPFNC